MVSALTIVSVYNTLNGNLFRAASETAKWVSDKLQK